MCVFIEEVLVAVQCTFNFTNEIKSQNINKQSILVWTSQVALAVKKAPANAGEARDEGSVPGLRRSPGGGNGNPTPVFLPGESHGRRSLVGCSPRGHKEWDTTERLHSLTQD